MAICERTVGGAADHRHCSSVLPCQLNHTGDAAAAARCAVRTDVLLRGERYSDRIVRDAHRLGQPTPQAPARVTHREGHVTGSRERLQSDVAALLPAVLHGVHAQLEQRLVERLNNRESRLLIKVDDRVRYVSKFALTLEAAKFLEAISQGVRPHRRKIMRHARAVSCVPSCIRLR